MAKEKSEISEPFKSPRGMRDILPSDHEYHTYLKKVIRHRARQAGFRRISTPVLEYTGVFKQSLGENSDIFTNQVYTFDDKKGHDISLKPDGTPGIVRAYIQHNMDEWPQPVLLYYFEPHFRYEKPQKGRYRQFWQFGFEIIGENDPALDAQCIQLANKINEDLGVNGLFTLQLNTIGTAESREKYSQVLEDYYVGKERSLCENCKKLLKENPLRMLDCNEEDCKILAELAPSMHDYIDKESLEYHEELMEYLDEIGIKYVNNQKLVRCLDYYTKTVFEFWDEKDGSKNATGGGGRYDSLIESMGGKSIPAVGYAAGVERIIANMKKEKIAVPSKDELHVFVAQLGREAKSKCLGLIEDMREAGLKTMGALGKGSINIQLGLADKFKVPYAVLIGITEVRENSAIIRDMKKGVQETVKMEKVVDRLVELIGENNLDKYSPGELLYS